MTLGYVKLRIFSGTSTANTS